MNLNGGGCFRPSKKPKPVAVKISKRESGFVHYNSQSRTGGGAALRFLCAFGFFHSAVNFSYQL